MAGDLVLITGATGHLGFRVLRYALEAGYSVRAAVRSEAKAETLKSNKALTPKERQSPLSFVVVPDILAPGAYDAAVKDVKYIIHVASPLSGNAPGGDYDTHIINPAIQGTLNILEAAKKSPSVKRVVITSSVVAITPVAGFAPDNNAATADPVTATSRVEEFTGPYPNPLVAYIASKVAALNRGEKWMKDNSPPFDLIHIHPSYIEGRNDLAEKLEDFQSGTNRFIVNLALGEKPEAPNLLTTNHVDDSAYTHVASLNPAVQGNQSFLVTSSGQDGVKWNDVVEIVGRRFPEAVKKGILSTEGNQGTYYYPYDAKKTEETFGFKFKTFEEQVVSVVGHYLEVYEREKGGK
ncbi:hypothetical protein M409DRAFT_20336 [Zasmidium cellare ATCC 36951]|uniref:NAD-dependent epimerase/dehydratase domain-containing protein n=1 Tax=Zasmidium cellare ATCC 36951 TaxID=1080233 RepID=A0A6A6CPA1_ZASCE|nr:uncharacterized protein M409DRAFT_20336 [Zasmidium cellare ATCC 36951]KAF2169107.1 hypothetical protein M409DRAFT_20336 [Zasmidium cellare ATCC 36951]